MNAILPLVYTFFSFRDFVDFNKENKPINLASPPQTFSPVPTFEPAPKQVRQTSPKLFKIRREGADGGWVGGGGQVMIGQNMLQKMAGGTLRNEKSPLPLVEFCPEKD